MSTPAVRAIEEAGFEYTLHSYEVDEAVGDGYGEAVAAAIGADPTTVFKSLIAVVDGEPVVAVIPVETRLGMKKLASAAGGRKAEMAATGDAERITGYVSGGVSPLGQRRTHRTFLDESASQFRSIYVSAGKRGLQVEIAVEDLLILTGGVLTELM